MACRIDTGLGALHSRAAWFEAGNDDVLEGHVYHILRWYDAETGRAFTRPSPAGPGVSPADLADRTQPISTPHVPMGVARFVMSFDIAKEL
jgi:hypothetical protein